MFTVLAGTGKVNWKGVAYYNRLINYMLKIGMPRTVNVSFDIHPQKNKNENENHLIRGTCFNSKAERCSAA